MPTSIQDFQLLTKKFVVRTTWLSLLIMTIVVFLSVLLVDQITVIGNEMYV